MMMRFLMAALRVFDVGIKLIRRIHLKFFKINAIRHLWRALSELDGAMTLKYFESIRID